MYFIYKITNRNNGKIYIGQTSKTIRERWMRHCSDAISGRLNTHLANAIKKYGVDAFIVECIEQVSNQEESNLREYYWISYYNTIKDGYNETYSPIKCGGNTYAGRTEEEMILTKQKLSSSKRGGKNPMSRSVKCKSIATGVELFFDSIKECQDYFNYPNHTFISARLNGRISCLWKREWAFAYTNEEYRNFTIEKGNGKRK